MITCHPRLATSFETVKLDKIQTQMFHILLKSRLNEQTYIRTKIFIMANLKFSLHRNQPHISKTVHSIPSLLLSSAAALITISSMISNLPMFLSVDSSPLVNSTEEGFSFDNATEYELVNEWGSE